MKPNSGKCLILVFLFFFNHLNGAVFSQEPGTAGDPLVTKSYIDQFFRFQTAVIPSGEKLKISSGAMFILLSGRMKLRSPKGKNLIDLTDGSRIKPDTFLPTNHLILAPETGEYSLEAQNSCTILSLGINKKN